MAHTLAGDQRLKWEDRMRGKVALLTGTAAVIMGERWASAATPLFVREGAKAVLTDIRDDMGERAAKALRADNMTRVTCTST